MEKNIGDQLNKAFEAYRQVTIEKDNAKRDLEQMVTTRVKCAKLYQYSKIISVFSCVLVHSLIAINQLLLTYSLIFTE